MCEGRTIQQFFDSLYQLQTQQVPCVHHRASLKFLKKLITVTDYRLQLCVYVVLVASGHIVVVLKVYIKIKLITLPE